MTAPTFSTPASGSPIPQDDPTRDLVLVRPDSDEGLRHIALAGDLYTILLSGEQTNGQYCLIDMRVPPGGGPPPHRHDFEEMFTVLEGQLQFTFRDEEVMVHSGQTVNIPANAPHFFRNTTESAARMLCMCSPAGQDEYFLRVATPVADPTALPPELTESEQAQQGKRAVDLAAQYRTELL